MRALSSFLRSPSLSDIYTGCDDVFNRAIRPEQCSVCPCNQPSATIFRHPMIFVAIWELAGGKPGEHGSQLNGFFG